MGMLCDLGVIGNNWYVWAMIDDNDDLSDPMLPINIVFTALFGGGLVASAIIYLVCCDKCLGMKCALASSRPITTGWGIGACIIWHTSVI